MFLATPETERQKVRVREKRGMRDKKRENIQNTKKYTRRREGETCKGEAKEKGGRGGAERGKDMAREREGQSSTGIN